MTRHSSQSTVTHASSLFNHTVCSTNKREREMVSPRNINSYLTKRFYNPKLPGSYTSVSKLYQVIKKEGKHKISLKQIQEWAKGQDILTLHKTVKEKQPAYRRIVTPGLNHLWDSDLLVLTGERFSGANSGNSYIVITVDVFSRFCRAEAVKNKGGKEMARAFTKIFERANTRPTFIRTDHGKEYSNAALQQLFKENGVTHYFSNTETKANYSEILIKNIKKRLFQFFQRSNSYSYTEELQSIVDSYNNTLHSSINMSPAEVNQSNQQQVWDYQYVTNSSTYKSSLKRALKASTSGSSGKPKFKYKPGDTVRVSHFRRKPFDRAYDEQFSGEVFTVRSRRFDEGIPIYYLNDFSKEEIKGHFYQGEITSVIYDPKALFKIEKVLKNRVRNGVKESLVKYQSWPDRYNEWLETKSLVSLPKGNSAKRRSKRGRRR